MKGEAELWAGSRASQMHENAESSLELVRVEYSCMGGAG